MIEKLDWKKTVEDDEDFLLFFCHLHFDISLAYMPALDFKKYIHHKTGERTFSEAAAAAYNKVWNDYTDINGSELDRYALITPLHEEIKKWDSHPDEPKNTIDIHDLETGEVFYIGEYIGELPILSVIYNAYNENQKVGYAVLSEDETHIKMYDNIAKKSIECWPVSKTTNHYSFFFYKEL